MPEQRSGRYAWSTRGPDRLVLVIGGFGSGKSTLINRLLGSDPEAPCSDSKLAGGTADIREYRVLPGAPIYSHSKHNPEDLILVDTPGLDGRYNKEELITSIRGYLEESFASRKATISGVIYLHEASTLSDTHDVDLDMISRAVGNHLWRSVVFGATHKGSDWHEGAQLSRANGIGHDFWTRPLSAGAQRALVRNTEGSAQALFKLLACKMGMPARDIILVMGRAGAGKSRFLNDIAAMPLASENDDFESSQSIEFYNVYLGAAEGNRAIIDCPGYNHTKLQDRHVTSKIHDFLSSGSFSTEHQILGIIFLVDLTGSVDTMNSECSQIFKNTHLTCHKLIAVTCHPDYSQSRVPKFKTCVKEVFSESARFESFPYAAVGYAEPLARSITDTSPNTSPVPLQKFLDKVLPK